MRKFYPVYEPSITKKEIAYSLKAIRSGWISSLGYYVNEFERNFAEYCGVKYAVSVCNGTAGLHLALYSLGVTKDDEVIIPDFSFISTANAVSSLNAIPVFVDVDKRTFCIDFNKIEEAVTPRTKAIIPVHIYGHPANMNKIIKIAKKYKLVIVEDCAEAHGASIHDKKVGSFGDCGVFSFYGNKIITTGEGGMIVTNNDVLYKRLCCLRDQAMDKRKKYWHNEIGFNYRMTNIQAAIGLAQLERINQIIIRKRSIFDFYRKYLQDIPGIKLNYEQTGYRNVFWVICLLIEDYTRIQRDKFINKLKEEGIDTRPFFYAMSDMPMYRNLESFTPVTHVISEKGLYLPSYNNLKESDIKHICKIIKSILIK